mmetsp:Transcript_21843/g.61059  ORF Transcript_21843/g.61059 Transcript_21843/m.61059 type:complete len:360 (+) Transcript_21843:72-1151(+)
MMQFLGAAAAAAAKHTNEDVVSEKNYDRAAPVSGGDGEVHVLMFALDYKRTSNPLTCTMDAKNMKTLCAACGIADVTIMLDEQCTKENVLRAIAEVGGRCEEDDYFVIYYSGHGTSVKDEDGDEDDGKDEAFCFVLEDGSITADSLMTDDEFSAAVTEATEETVRCLILTDCCHSGTIADLDADCWQGREAISITGCLDSQTSGDMGKGGIFTHAMLLAVDQLQDAGQEDYSVGMLFNATLEKDQKVFSSAQDITIQSTVSVTPDKMAWPLVPTSMNYKAPLTQAASQSAGGAEVSAAQVNLGALNPQMLASLGIKPNLLQYVNQAGLQEGEIDIGKILKAGTAAWMAGDCTKDSCAIS